MTSCSASVSLEVLRQEGSDDKWYRRGRDVNKVLRWERRELFWICWVPQHLLRLSFQSILVWCAWYIIDWCVYQKAATNKCNSSRLYDLGQPKTDSVSERSCYTTSFTSRDLKIRSVDPETTSHIHWIKSMWRILPGKFFFRLDLANISAKTP